MLKLNKNTILTGVAAAGILITGALIFINQNPGQFSFSGFGFGLSNDAIAKKSIDYLNKSILSGQAPASLVSVSEESGLVKIKIKIGSNEYDSYATKDGKLLFPQAFNMGPVSSAEQPSQNTASAQPSAEQTKQTCDSLPKTSKPVLEAYLVSRCPFGLQMQRVLADVIKNAPSLAQNIKVRYIGAVSRDTITSMHGDAEAKENLRQICIREEQNSKYWSYVSCQMKKGDTSGCEASSGIDSSKLNACISDKNRGLAYAKEDFDLTNKYGVQGSPTLVLADKQISEFDFGGRSSEAVKEIVCCSSSSEPGACSAKLNTAEAATSFSETYGGSGGSGNSGNSGSTGANCAPAQ